MEACNQLPAVLQPFLYLSKFNDSSFFQCLNLFYSLNFSAAQQCVTALCSHKNNINVTWCEMVLTPRSVDEKYRVCQHVQGLQRELHHSAHSLCEHCIHFNSLCVKLNEFGFFASLVIVLGNKTRGKGITFPHLNFKGIKSLKQTKQKWLLKFIGEVMYGLNFQSVFWVCYKFFQIKNAVFGDSSACVLGEPSWWVKVRILSSMAEGFVEVVWGAGPCSWHWGLKRWSRQRLCPSGWDDVAQEGDSRRGMEENCR